MEAGYPDLKLRTFDEGQTIREKNHKYHMGNNFKWNKHVYKLLYQHLPESLEK
jgi:hypothetical protein